MNGRLDFNYLKLKSNIMKSKFLTIVFIALTISGISLKAQDKNMTELQIKQQQEQFKDRYELQKKTIQNTYKTDKEALEANKNLTPAQRKQQGDIIKDRYEQQKKVNQEAFKTEKNTIKEAREGLNKGKHKGEEAGEKNKMKEKAKVHMEKKKPEVKPAPKPVKHQ